MKSVEKMWIAAFAFLLISFLLYIPNTKAIAEAVKSALIDYRPTQLN
ncbi:MAG: hypothetical protein KME31_14640 [Tolypothrix carrinoi HA7290-LM1]|nr:hypothetical protein [Tolypothrix carrinoi HA7290-LM1]